MKTLNRIVLVAAVPALLAMQSWLCPPALADKVCLKNGEVIEGLVSRETDNDVTVDFGFGQTTLDRKDIVKIEKCPFEMKGSGTAAPAGPKTGAAKPPAKPPAPAAKPAPPKPAPPKPQVMTPPSKPGKTKNASATEGVPGGETPPAATPPSQDTGGTKKK